MQVFEVIVPVVLAQAPAQPAAGAFDVNGATTAAPSTTGGTVANGGTTGPVGPGGTAAPAAGGLGPMIWLLPGMLLVMILFSTMSGRKEKKKRAELMSSVQKGDKVQMLGGIIGTIHEIADDEIVLNVETGRIRFARTALQTILKSKSGSKADSIAEAKPEAKGALV